jgi:Flp pilus assembly protein TadG
MKTTHSQRGSAIVETAIVLLVALMLVLGIMDFGRCLYTYHTISDIARLGARFAIVRGATCNANATTLGASTTYCSPTDSKTTGADSNDIQTYVRSLPLGIIDAPNVAVTSTWTATNDCSTTTYSLSNGPGCQVAVQVQYTFKFMWPIAATSIPMSSTSTMIISQ